MRYHPLEVAYYEVAIFAASRLLDAMPKIFNDVTEVISETPALDINILTVKNYS